MTQPRQRQAHPGEEKQMRPKADHGEQSYRGAGRLKGKATVITGADSGIGRAVAIAFAREGADVLISYLEEHEDARETARWVEQAWRSSSPTRASAPTAWRRARAGRRSSPPPSAPTTWRSSAPPRP